MKKLLALLVSAMMAVSLAVPAFAAPGLSPEEAASLGVIGGADGPTAIFTTSPVDWGVLLDESYMDSDTAIDWFKEKHPERVAALRANVKDFYEQEYGEYWTAEQYMEEFGVTEEEFLEDMVKEQLLRLYFDEGSQWIADMQKEAMGGVVGQIGVIVNGTYVQFPDAAPEVANGRTMVPVRALVESLGGEVEADGGKIVCRTDEVSITFTLGSAEALVEYPGGGLPGDGQIFPLGCAPYLKGGRTYVPVRFTAEALGYEVGWDSAYQTAVLLDREVMAAEIDKDFTILNKVQANKGVYMEEGKNYRADAKGSISLTLFDTLNGNKTYKADLTAKQLFNTEAASANLSLKLSDIALDDLEALLTDLYGADFEENAILFRAVAEGLDDIEVIFTREGSAWFRAAALDELAGKDNVWLAQDLGAEWGGLAFVQAGDATIGKVLAYTVDGDSAPHYQSMLGMAEMLAGICGDDKFTTSGGASTLTIDLDSLMGMYGDMGLDESDMEEARAAFKEYKITMKVDSKGGAVVTCAIETNAQPGVPGMKIAMDVTQSGGSVSMTMSYHIANVGEMKLTLTQTQKTTTDKPMTQPPEGAVVVDAPELLNP